MSDHSIQPLKAIRLIHRSLCVPIRRFDVFHFVDVLTFPTSSTVFHIRHNVLAPSAPMDIDQALLFDASITDAIDRMAEVGKLRFGMNHPPRIAMMAIVCELAMEISGPKALDLDAVRTYCASSVRYTKASKKYSTKRYQSFHNSATLLFGTKAVKVFSNGKLHITGVKTVAEAHECVRSFLRMMLVEEENCAAIADAIEFTTKILNINCCVKPAGKLAISLEKLQQKFQNHNANIAPSAEDATRTKGAAGARISSTRYHPDIYQALVAKMRCSADAHKDVSALIFYTGTVILTGARLASDLEESFELVCSEMMADDIGLDV